MIYHLVFDIMSRTAIPS